MSLFHENLKQILAEVEKFLNESLKKEKLGKKALEHKTLIMEKLESFFQENPTMKLNQSQETVSVSDDSVVTGGSTVSDESEGTYNDAGLAILAVTDLKDPVYAGFLEKKQKKGSGLFGTAKFQTRWCVIHKDTFYYFARQDGKKQQGSFGLEGYRFRNAPDLVPKKKELCFELYHQDDKKRIYQFMAKNKEEYDQWQMAVESREEKIYHQIMENNSRANPKDISSKVENQETPPEDIYEAPRSVPERPSVTGSPAVQPKSPNSTEAVVDITDEGLYYDAFSAVKSEEKHPTQLPSPTTPLSSSILKSPTRDLPPTPVPKKLIKINLTCKPEEDFENNFYGKWDCTADNDNELSFQRGDIIHILSREFDEKSWWLGELNGNFGLVPKNYLVPAYTLVTY